MFSGSAEVYLRAGRAQAQPKNCANDAPDQGLPAIDWLLSIGLPQRWQPLQ